MMLTIYKCFFYIVSRDSRVPQLNTSGTANQHKITSKNSWANNFPDINFQRPVEPSRSKAVFT